MRERERGEAPCRKSDVGLDPRTPGSRPGPKAGAKLLRHPGIPEQVPLKELVFLLIPKQRRHVCHTEPRGAARGGGGDGRQEEQGESTDLSYCRGGKQAGGNSSPVGRRRDTDVEAAVGRLY